MQSPFSHVIYIPVELQKGAVVRTLDASDRKQAGISLSKNGDSTDPSDPNAGQVEEVLAHRVAGGRVLPVPALLLSRTLSGGACFITPTAEPSLQEAGDVMPSRFRLCNSGSTIHKGFCLPHSRF